jgi:lysophospholipase L1-like esterase
MAMDWARITRSVRTFGKGVLIVLGVAATGIVVVLLRILLWSTVKDAGGDAIEYLPDLPPVALPAGHRVYVALGDSYSSGEGVRPYEPGSGDAKDGGDRCHRSQDAYPMQIHFASRVEVRFRACSGARIEDMYETQRTDGGGNRLGPQLAPGVLGPDVGLVTMTIGGNDFGFVQVLRHCATHAYCMNDTFDDRFDDGRASGHSLSEWLDRKLETVAQDLYDLIRRIRKRAPNARVLLIGYPNLFWTSWGDTQSEDCLLQSVFGQKEVNPLLDFQYRYSRVSEAIAQQTGAEFVWTADIFSGHEPCGAITPRWMDFVPLSSIGGGHLILDPGAMHPNRNGHYILSRIATCYLLQNPESTETYDGKALKECARYGHYKPRAAAPG